MGSLLQAECKESSTPWGVEAVFSSLREASLPAWEENCSQRAKGALIDTQGLQAMGSTKLPLAPEVWEVLQDVALL